MENNIEEMSCPQAAKFSNVKPAAISLSIKEGRIKAEKIDGRWVIKKEDLEEYLKNRYKREKSIYKGEKRFDPEKGEMSPMMACKYIKEKFGKDVSSQQIYHKMRTNQMDSIKKGCCWVVYKCDVDRIWRRS